MGIDYDRAENIKELQELARHTMEEAKLWKNTIPETLGLKNILAKGKKTPKNKNISKENNFIG